MQAKLKRILNLIKIINCNNKLNIDKLNIDKLNIDKLNIDN